MKVIFIDGPQLSGKSTLIKGLSAKYGWKVYKFPFSKYSSKLELSTKEELNGFQLGKDLASMYWIKSLAGNSEGVLLVDRGPMSSAYYSLTENRMPTKMVHRFIRELSEFGNDFIYIFITANNRPEEVIREKNDGFDGLDKGEEDIEAVCSLSSMAFWNSLKLKLFVNDFSSSIEENLDNLIKTIEEVL